MVGPPGRILLIKPSSLGDVVMALPALSALRRSFPQARISWLIQCLQRKKHISRKGEWKNYHTGDFSLQDGSLITRVHPL